MSDLMILSDHETAQINGGLFNFTPITSISRVRNTSTQTATAGGALSNGGSGGFFGSGGGSTAGGGATASNTSTQTATSTSALNVNYISLL
jgi:hypothetical protein